MKTFTINFSPRAPSVDWSACQPRPKRKNEPNSNKLEARNMRCTKSSEAPPSFLSRHCVKRLLLCFVLMELVVVHSRGVRSLHSFTVDSKQTTLNRYYRSFVSTFNDRPGSREFYHETSRPRQAITSAPTARLANATQKFSDGDAAQRERDQG